MRIIYGAAKKLISKYELERAKTEMQKNENRPGYKKTTVGWIPAIWGFNPLGTVLASSKYGCNAPSTVNGNTPVVGMKDIQARRLVLSSLSRVNLSRGEWGKTTIGEVFSFLKTYALSREQLTTDQVVGSDIHNIHYGDLHATYDGCILDCEKETRIPRVRNSMDLPLNNLVTGTIRLPQFVSDGKSAATNGVSE